VNPQGGASVPASRCALLQRSPTTKKISRRAHFFFRLRNLFRNVLRVLGAEPDNPKLTPSTESFAWFCVRSQPKHEQLAAAHLELMGQIEVFNPRIRFARATQHGPVWVTESMFPNYIFVRFDWKTSLNRVHFAPGVSGIVHFGSQWPTIPDAVINDLRALVGAAGLHNTEQAIKVGDPVKISGGPLHGLDAVITQIMPGQQRVAVLLDFLGRQATVHVGVPSITRTLSARQ
jgi:transcriptional antiterminator RfaH